MRTLDESKALFLFIFVLFLVLIKGMKKEGESKNTLCYLRGLGASPQSFHKRIGVKSLIDLFLTDTALSFKG